LEIGLLPPNKINLI